jgi:hypothetical protein
MNKQDYLRDCDSRYNEQLRMVGLPFHSPGYHSRVSSGTWVHPIITAFEYALLLLQTGEPARVERAIGVLDHLLTLQDVDPTSKTYGIWPYLAEEPLAEMAPPDWNWAEFCGFRIAQALRCYEACFSASFTGQLRTALEHAAWSVFRRNVTPGYTNIAIMGGGVCAVAGEILGQPSLLAYGRRRLQNCVTHAAYHGTFTEYNSPAYTPLALHETERILQLVSDPATRTAAEQLRRVSWEVIASHFHPGTGQWAGPHARTYSDRLDDEFIEELSQRTGVAIQPTGGAANRLWCGPIDLTVPTLPCPPDLIARFRALPEDPVRLRTNFIRRADEATSTRGTTWMTAEACLGSVSRENLWYQRHPVIGYWKTNNAVPAVLRLRFLCDGVDFSSAYVRSVQCDTKVLSSISLVTGLGYNALHMDAPPKGIFEAADFRVRYHLIAPGATGAGNELRAGAWRAHIHPAPGKFGPFTVRWETGQGDGEAWVDGVCYQGPKRSFEFAEFGEVALAAGLEILAETTRPSVLTPVFVEPARIEWEGLSVTTSLHTEPYLWA